MRFVYGFVALCLGFMLVACGGGDDKKSQPAASADSVKESFASLAGTKTNFVIAVGPGTRVRAYACDGDATALWWTGESANGAFTATSTDGGATLTAKLGDTISGKVTFKDGKSVDFTAKATTGAQGLYTVELQSDGKMTGSSLAGNTFAGQFDFAKNTLSGEVTAGGKKVKIDASQSQTGGKTPPGTYMAVLDERGQAKGFQMRSPGKPADGFIAGWVMP